MAEPVAYRVDGTIYNNINDAEFAVRETEHLRKYLGIDNGLIKKPVYIEPLYTSEQLHPRVKMTQAEFDEFKRLFECVDYASIATATIANVKDDFNKLEERICSGNVDERIKKQNEFNVLWSDYDPDNPEETIEIVPDMKWFVRSKNKSKNGKYLWLCDAEYLDVPQCMFTRDNQMSAMMFDTKSEAEKWTNPLTEAVQLPVEGE